MKKLVAGVVIGLAVLMGVYARPVSGQDLNTLLVTFLRHFVAGKIYASVNQSVEVAGVTTFAVSSSFVTLTCDGAETIQTITGGVSGMVLYIAHGDTDCSLDDDDTATATDAIDLVGTNTDDAGAVNKVTTLFYNGSHWLQIAESDN